PLVAAYSATPPPPPSRRTAPVRRNNPDIRNSRQEWENSLPVLALAHNIDQNSIQFQDHSLEQIGLHIELVRKRHILEIPQ
ncbi:MAG TPA: hypothetical protein PKC99_19090, partial [Anaerolineales bacterium]|nr:hypothetical protein [Anaerolineales bacterium]